MQTTETVAQPTIETEVRDKLRTLQKVIGASTVIMQRCSTLVGQRHKKTLAQYLMNGAPVAEKNALLDELIAIVQSPNRDSLLPPLAGGQAVDATVKIAAVAPVAATPIAPPVWRGSPTSVVPTPQVPNSAAELILAKIQARKDAAAAAAAVSAVPSITEERIIELIAEHTLSEDAIRSIIREEVERGLAAIAAALV